LVEEVGGVADALEDKEAAKDLLRWIHDNRTNEETNRDYRVALRILGRRVTEGDEPPNPSNGLRVVRPRTMTQLLNRRRCWIGRRMFSQ
jgi:hypothetical protein